MGRPTALVRLFLRVIPALFLAGLGISALVGWYAATESGLSAGLNVFALLGLTTLFMTGLLAWTLRRATRETARAEAALQDANDNSERFRELLELSSDWYWEQDAQFRFTVMSGGVVNKGGFRIADTLGKTRWELPIEDMGEADWAAHRAVLERHEAFRDLRYGIRAADGSVRNFSISGRPRFDARGTFVGYRGTGRDITAAAVAEQALRESEERFALAIAATTDGIWDYDPRSNTSYFSPGFIRLLGYADRQALQDGFHLAKALHPDDREYVLERQRILLEHGGRFDETYRLKTAQGDYRWFRGRGQAIADTTGRVYRFTGALADIDEQKQAELKLRLAAAVFENSLEGVTITDADGNIVSVNRAFTRITGYEAGEAIGKNPRILKSGRQDAAFYESMWQVLTHEGAWSGEIRNKRKNGEIYPELLGITALRDEQGKLLHYIGVFTDITDLKRAEEAVLAANVNLEQRVKERTAELEASNRELEAFSYSVSHDLRGPLRGIEGFAHVIAEDYAHCLDKAGLDHLDRIRQAARRMSQTIDDLHDLSRISRADLRRREVDLSTLARAIAHDLLEKDAGRAARFRIAADLRAWADPTLAATLLGNLLGNAWKFTARQPEALIEFGADDGGGEPVFFVRDNGAGFDMAYADKLFRPFQHLHRPDEFTGTGIGLATAARIVRRHGGHIRAESQPGRGATFFFTLPS